MLLIGLGLGLALQYGLATNSEVKLEGWPEDIEVIEHHVSFPEMLSECTTPAMLLTLSLPLACAKPNIILNTCHIYYGPLTTDGVIEHERGHCQGRLHLVSNYAEAQERLDTHKVYRQAYLELKRRTPTGHRDAANILHPLALAGDQPAQRMLIAILFESAEIREAYQWAIQRITTNETRSMIVVAKSILEHDFAGTDRDLARSLLDSAASQGSGEAKVLREKHWPTAVDNEGWTAEERDQNLPEQD